MVILDEQKIKYAKRGEIAGIIFLAVAAAGALLFAVCYPIARARDIGTLEYVSYSLPPVLIALGAAGAAVCNIKYGAYADKLIRQYILDVCLENPQAMHPERDSLTFYISLAGCKFLMRANGYKENLIFDFSVLERLSPARRAAITTEICNRITVSFCRLYERGAKYKDVAYTCGNGFKKGKTVPVITGGVPDKKAYKLYLKNKRN